MKLHSIKILAVFLLISTAFAGAYIEYFHVRSEGDNIVVEWKTGQETNIKNFVIERSNPPGAYSVIATIQPQGSNSVYSYVDKSAYKTSDMVFRYQLNIVDNNGQVTTVNEASISQNISGVKRTWGSIKAMFR